MEGNIENAQNAEVVSVTETQVQASEVQPSEITWREGVTVSLFGMAIVFFGLVLTFCYISSLPYIAGEKRKKKPANEKVDENVSDSTVTAGGEIEPSLQAAIAYVIAAEQEYERMTDYTKITIRRDEHQRAWGVAGKMRTLATRKISKK